MRIGCLQFSPQVGEVDNNLNRADAVLSKAEVEELDLLVLPELAFTGYNFKSLRQIMPFLEYSGSGITSLWARTTALRYDCVVVAGYPEKIDPLDKWPTGPEYYNSAIVVNAEGETIANYRKSFLYYTDESWALEGEGFYQGFIPGLGKTSIGICMDLNPYRFEASWDEYEFAFHILEVKANLVIVSMAWMTRESRSQFTQMPNEPDMDTLTYWVTRLEPLIRSNSKHEIIVVFGNRSGFEDEATYAGTSAVIGVQDGEVRVYGILGRGQKDLLVVDTDNTPYAKMVYGNDSEKSGTQPGTSDETGPQQPATDSRPPGPKSPDPNGQPPRAGTGSSDKPELGNERSVSASTHSIAKQSTQSTSKRLSEETAPQDIDVPLTAYSETTPSTPPVQPPPSRQTLSISIPQAETSSPGPGLRNADKTGNSPGIRTPPAHKPHHMPDRPRLIIPQSPPVLSHHYSSEPPISAASETSVRSLQSVKSDESEASTHTIRSNHRPPEDSTPYPHSGLPLSGYPSNSFHFQDDLRSSDICIGFDADFSTNSTPFYDVSPTSEHAVWRQQDDVFPDQRSAGARVAITPVGRQPGPWPWASLMSEDPVGADRDSYTFHAPDTVQEKRRHTSKSRSPSTPTIQPQRGRTSDSATSANSERESIPVRPWPPKSRNASRSRVEERSDSGTRTDLSAVLSQLDLVSQLAESGSRQRSETQRGSTISHSPKPQASHQRSRSRPSGDIDFLNNWQNSITIAASPSIFSNGSRQSSNGQSSGSRHRSRLTSRFDPPQRSNASPRASSQSHRSHGMPSAEMFTSPRSESLRHGSRSVSRGRRMPRELSGQDLNEGLDSHERSVSADSSRNELLHTRTSKDRSRGHDSKSSRQSSRDRHRTDYESYKAFDSLLHGQHTTSSTIMSAKKTATDPSLGSGHTGRHKSRSRMSTRDASSSSARIVNDWQKTTSSVIARAGSQHHNASALDMNESRDRKASDVSSDCGLSIDTLRSTSSSSVRSPPTPVSFEPSTPRAMPVMITKDGDLEDIGSMELDVDDRLMGLQYGKSDQIRDVEGTRTTVA